MKNIILIMIFVLLIIGAFFIIGINPFRRKSYISLAKQVQEEKFRNMLFTDTTLALVTGFAFIPIPYIFLKVKSRWYKRNQDELLENTLSIITDSYIVCNDIIKATNENLSKLDIQKPFAEFITDVTLIDSNIRDVCDDWRLK